MRVIHSTTLFLVVAACGSNNPAVDALIVHDGPSTQHDAPPPHDASPPPDAPAMLETQVAIAEGTGPNGAMANVSANVYAGDIYGIQAGTDGPCTLYHTAQPPQLSAGTIAVTGTTTAYTLTPTGTAPNVHYTTSPQAAAPLFTTGATISITAAGADVPAFSGTVTAPAPLAGFTPPTTVSRSGFTAAWTAGSGPKVWVILPGFDGSTTEILVCRVDDTGTFTVPPSSFALMSGADNQAVVGLARVSETLTNSPYVSLVAVSEVIGGVVPLTQ